MSTELERSERPWGTYQVLLDGELCKVKIITVKPGQRLSYQTHSKRKEHWTVVAGTGTVTLNGETHTLPPGSSIDIAMGAAHRMENKGQETLQFVEVQMGSYFGEDDIVRLSDDYGRTHN